MFRMRSLLNCRLKRISRSSAMNESGDIPHGCSHFTWQQIREHVLHKHCNCSELLCTLQTILTKTHMKYAANCCLRSCNSFYMKRLPKVFIYLLIFFYFFFCALFGIGNTPLNNLTISCRAIRVHSQQFISKAESIQSTISQPNLSSWMGTIRWLQ